MKSEFYVAKSWAGRVGREPLVAPKPEDLELKYAAEMDVLLTPKTLVVFNEIKYQVCVYIVFPLVNTVRYVITDWD